MKTETIPVVKRNHEALEHRVTMLEVERMAEVCHELNIAKLIQQFKTVDRMRKLKPGQSIRMTIYRSGEHSWGDFVGIRLEDPNVTTKPSPSSPPTP